MKKFIVPAVSLAILSCVSFNAFAGTNLRVSAINQSQVMDTSALNKSDAAKKCTMVPLEETAKKLGFTVTKQNDGYLLDDGEMHTTVTVGEDSYIASTSIEGAIGTTAPFSFGQAPYISDGVVYVPEELFTVLTGDDNNVETENNTGEEDILIPGIPNPLVEYENLAEAEKAAGLKLSVPENVMGYKEAIYSVIDNSLLQIDFVNGDDRLVIRKAQGSENISGDYNDYSNETTEKINGADVKIKGSGKANCAVWTNGSYSYSIGVYNTNSEGIDFETMKSIISGIN